MERWDVYYEFVGGEEPHEQATKTNKMSSHGEEDDEHMLYMESLKRAGMLGVTGGEADEDQTTDDEAGASQVPQLGEDDEGPPDVQEVTLSLGPVLQSSPRQDKSPAAGSPEVDSNDVETPSSPILMPKRVDAKAANPAPAVEKTEPAPAALKKRERQEAGLAEHETQTDASQPTE